MFTKTQEGAWTESRTDNNVTEVAVIIHLFTLNLISHHKSPCFDALLIYFVSKQSTESESFKYFEILHIEILIWKRSLTRRCRYHGPLVWKNEHLDVF